MVFDFEERRRFPRLKISSALRFKVRGIPEFGNAAGDNISEGGLGFFYDRFIAPSTLLMLEINVLERMLHPIGRVTSSIPIAHSDRKRLGIEFIEFDPEEKNYLLDYINMRLSS